MQDEYTITISDDQAKTRLDKILSQALPDLSRSRIQSLIKEGCVKLQGGKTPLSPSVKVKGGERYSVHPPAPEPAEPIAQNIPLDIVYEDDDLIVVNKAAGMVVHPAAGSPDQTLVNALLYHCKNSLSGIGGVARPGIVHRIDKDTSGLLVAAKHDKAHNGLAKQFADHSIGRIYSAVCRGAPDKLTARIEGNIGRIDRDRKKIDVVDDSSGKWAATHYRTRVHYMSDKKIIASQIECKLETGRTHQVRVHMNHIGHALIGDPLYGRARSLPNGINTHIRAAIQSFGRQALHARLLAFIHPISGKPLKFDAALPYDMQRLIEILQDRGQAYDTDVEAFSV